MKFKPSNDVVYVVPVKDAKHAKLVLDALLKKGYHFLSPARREDYLSDMTECGSLHQGNLVVGWDKWDKGAIYSNADENDGQRHYIIKKNVMHVPRLSNFS